MDLEKKFGVNIDTPHEEKYRKIVEGLGMDKVRACVPFSLEELQKSYDLDKSFNTEITPLSVWTRAAGFVEHGSSVTYIGSDLARLYFKAGVHTFSPAQGVCILKQCAKDMLREGKE